MQFLTFHIHEENNKFVVTDNVSTLRGEGETVEEAIGAYIFKAFCGVLVSSSSIDPGIFEKLEHMPGGHIIYGIR